MLPPSDTWVVSPGHRLRRRQCRRHHPLPIPEQHLPPARCAMSNPVQYPAQPPQAPFPQRSRRSFAGPLVLIVIGLVFLLGNLHLLSWIRLGTLFARYWPALLILWGVIKIVEYQQAQREGLPARGIGAGGVILIVAIVFFGLIATQAERAHEHWPSIREQFNIDDSDFEN